MPSKSLHRSSVPALLALGAIIGSAGVARAQTVLTDTSPTPSREGYASASSVVSMGLSFILSDGPWDLFDITVQMSASPFNGGVNTLSGSLWSDNGSGLPGAQIAALKLTGGTVGTTLSPLTFSPTGTVTLTASTPYWFVARTGAPGAISTGIGTNTGLHGLNSPAIAVRIGDGPFGIGVRGKTPAMTVRGVVPEPGEWAAMGVLGLALGGLVVRKRRTR